MSAARLIAAALLLIPFSAAAETPRLPKGHPPLTRAPAPEQSREAPSLDDLFRRLAEAKDAAAANAVGRQIEARWLASGSDTIDLLTGRAAIALREQNAPLALDLLDAVIALKPDYAEAWHMRATAHFLAKDLPRALGALEQTLRLEPRHYAALAGLGTILAEIGDKRRALDAYRRALAIHPHLEGLAKRRDELAQEVEGHET